MKIISALLVALPIGASISSGAVLFSDNFDRDNSNNIQNSNTGVINNTGSILNGGTPGTIYSQPHLDPLNRAPGYANPDTIASNGGGARILNNQLQLAAQQPGTSNAYINHNFVNASIVAAGGFSVSLDITAYEGTANIQGGAFAVGLSKSEADSAGDAYDLAATPEGNKRMTGAFHETAILNSTVGNTVVSDFWIALRGNGSLVWGGASGSTLNGVAGVGRTGTVSVDFSFSSFAAGSTVNYTVYLNSVQQGQGTFAWSESNQNYIGLDARSGPGTSFDNLVIQTIPEPSAALLGLLAAPGLLRRKRR